MPSVRPNDRNSQLNIVQRRTARSHESSRWPVIERRDAERERNRHADEAGVERRRMNRHPVVLQQRVQPLAVGRRRASERS